MKRTRYLIIIWLAFIFFGCEKKADQPRNEKEHKGTVPLSYAEGFQIRKDSGYTWVEVRQPYQGSASGLFYLLVPKGKTVPAHDAKYRVIRTPVSSIVCTSTTHIPLLDYLGETDKLIGFPTTDYISSVQTRKRIDEGKVVDLGVDRGLNIEKLTVLKPELLMGYTMTSDYGQFKKIEELGIPVIINSEYLEKHPLGRAEWIKFVGLLFNKEKKADSVFNDIAGNYLRTKELTRNVASKPTVLSGIMYGDAWFLPGGKNYASTILADAGFNYLWKDDSSHGYLELSFETVYAKAMDSDFWIGVGTFQNLQEISAADTRYSKFKAFREKNVYSYDARKGTKGGNEYLELGYLRPDIILKDLVKIAHSDLLPSHQLYFHKKLN